MISGSRHFPRPPDFCPPAHAPPLAPNSDTNSMHMCSLAREVLPHTDTQPGPLSGRFQGLHCLQHFSTCLVSPQNPPIILRHSSPSPACQAALDIRSVPSHLSGAHQEPWAEMPALLMSYLGAPVYLPSAPCRRDCVPWSRAHHIPINYPHSTAYKSEAQGLPWWRSG